MTKSTRTRLFLASLCTILVACGSSTEPVRQVSVTGIATKTVAGRPFLLNGAQVYACDFRIEVTANGFGSGSSVSWTGGRIDYRLNSTGQVASTYLYSSTQQEWFGSDKIAPSVTLSTSQRFAWAGPFTATLVMNYSIFNQDLSSESKTLSVALDCS